VLVITVDNASPLKVSRLNLFRQSSKPIIVVAVVLQRGLGLVSSGAGQGKLTSGFGHDNKSWNCIKGGQFIE
jgi:hypothetical protein